MTETLTFIEELSRETNKSESEVISMAFQTGIRQLRREHILGQYLRGEILRETAVERVGIDWVEMAEHQHKAMQEDLAWALKKQKKP
ncbi:MAG: hypothetical protein U5R06_14990 [candidate division KSB1 bacterium]|nr:hypothetical protein [candidate division KSB1 bacterium]